MLPVLVAGQPGLAPLGRVQPGIVPAQRPGRRRRGSPWPSRRARSAGQCRPGQVYGGGTERVERRATTGEAARRRGESYTRRSPAVYPCRGAVSSGIRDANPDLRARRVGRHAALLRLLRHGRAESWRRHRSRRDRRNRCGGPVAQPTMPDAPTRTERGPAAAGAPPRPQDATLLERALFEVKRVIVGQDRMIERMFVALLARGHCLLEGVPGVAKTLAVETLATVVGGTFARIQFTPDLVPADIVGTRIYRHVEREVRRRARPGVRQLPARRRDQPGAGQGAVGAARGDGRAAGLDRRRDPPRCPTRSW